MNDKDSVFELWSFHRALRKYLFTDASSICWNAIHVMEDEPLAAFCDAISTKQHPAQKTFAARCREAVPRGIASCNLLRIGFRLLEDEEWTVLEEQSYVAVDDENRVR